MTNAITAQTTASALAWTTKAGTVKQANSTTAQQFAPRATRLQAARASDLAALHNGQYRPFLRDVAAALTKSDTKALEKLGFILTPTNKAGMVHLLRGICALWATSKGVRAELRAVCAEWLEAVAPIESAPTGEESAPLPTLEALPDTTPAHAPSAPAPLPTIDPALI